MKNSNDYQSGALEMLAKSLGATTPAGLVVSNSSLNALVKSETDRLYGGNGRGRLFSNFKQGWLGLSAAHEKPYSTPSFSVLRETADKSPIDSIIIQARVLQTRHVAQPYLGRGQIGFDVVHIGSFDTNFQETRELKALCHEAKMWLSKPVEEVHSSFKNMMVEAIKDELVLDRRAMEIIPDSYGEPASYQLLPPETIKPRIEVLLPWLIDKYGKDKAMSQMSENAFRIAAERISQETGIDITNAAYVQEISNKIVAAFTKDEISIDVTNPSSEVDKWGYGKSCLESSLDVTLAFVRMWGAQRDYWARNMPDQILTILGNYDPESLEALKQSFKSEGPGAGNVWGMPIIASEPSMGVPNPASALQIDVKQVRQSLADMQWREGMTFCIQLKAAAYRADPSLVNFSVDQGADRVFIGGGTKESIIEHAREEGFHSLIDSQAAWLTRALLAKKRKYKDLMVIWKGLDDQDEQTQVTVYSAAFSGGLMTRNEARHRLGLMPVSREDGGEQFGDASYMQMKQTESMEEMSQMQMMVGGNSNETAKAPAQKGKPNKETKGGPSVMIERKRKQPEKKKSKNSK